MAYTYDETVPNGLYRSPAIVFATEPATERIDTIARIQGAEVFQFEQGDGQPLFARDGFFAVHESRVYLGEADSMEIQVRSLTGELMMIMRVPGFDLRLTPGEMAAERAAMLPPANAPPFIREAAASMPDRETRPAYSRLLVDAAGFVWAQEYHSASERDLASRCLIFGPDGAWLGIVTLPAHFTPFEIGRDYILGVSRDEADVEHVQELRLNRET